MKKKTKKNLATKSFDMTAVRNALDDMRRKCGGGDIPPKMISAAARELRLTPDELAEAAGRLNRPISVLTASPPRDAAPHVHFFPARHRTLFSIYESKGFIVITCCITVNLSVGPGTLRIRLIESSATV